MNQPGVEGDSPRTGPSRGVVPESTGISMGSVSRLPSADDPALTAVAGLRKLLYHLEQIQAEWKPSTSPRAGVQAFNQPCVTGEPPSYEYMMASVMRRKGAQ
jgi:hypothetical protein